jgi:alpha-glucosidase
MTDAHRALAVDQQLVQEDSPLVYFTRLIHWRRQQPALIHGDMSLLPLNDQVLAFVRETSTQRLLCAFNFSDREAVLPLSDDLKESVLLPGSGLSGARKVGGSLHFESWGGIFLTT